MKIGKSFSILWLTGVSGSGKSTLASYIGRKCEENGYKVIIIDGDDVRGRDEKKLGFGYEDVLKNNLRIAKFCLNLKSKGVEVVIVPVISPYEKVRRKVRDMLSPYLHLIYIKADIKSLKIRDTKGLYAAADDGIINNLIGYSKTNPYDEPINADIVIETGDHTSIDKSRELLFNYISRFIF